MDYPGHSFRENVDGSERYPTGVEREWENKGEMYHGIETETAD